MAENRVISGFKNGQCAPRFVSFCSMYGDVLSYPVEDAGVAMRSRIGARRGARCIARPIDLGRPAGSEPVEPTCRALSTPRGVAGATPCSRGRRLET